MRTNQDLARYLLEKLASIGITNSETNLIVRIHCHRQGGSAGPESLRRRTYRPT
jgi:hypothetical protein